MGDRYAVAPAPLKRYAFSRSISGGEQVMEDSDFIKRCAEREIYAYGTAYIFESRSRSLRFRLRILSFLSLAVPLSVGGIAMATADKNLLPVIVLISGVLSVPLFVMTLWSLVFRWEERRTSNITNSAQFFIFIVNKTIAT